MRLRLPIGKLLLHTLQDVPKRVLADPFLKDGDPQVFPHVVCHRDLGRVTHSSLDPGTGVR